MNGTCKHCLTENVNLCDACGRSEECCSHSPHCPTLVPVAVDPEVTANPEGV